MHPSLPGSYVLVLRLASPTAITVGSLGSIRFPKGYYAYVGSALGPGGLAARIGRHLAPVARQHWHIDALRSRARPVAVWSAVGRERRECVWARALSALPGVLTPAPGFGSTDCRCSTHLFHFDSRPRPAAVTEAAGDQLQCEDAE
ncbi:MAG: GIY-YIG nuclease family protein [Anaerolineales bacterium]|nr:MAG: GIY-YIG nuclease family protein [Anaerolineales bacterium]